MQGYHNKTAGRKVVASQYYKNKSNRKISRKERDYELYKRTSTDTPKIHHNARVQNSAFASKDQEMLESLSNPHESEEDAASAALKSGASLIRGIEIEGEISRKAGSRTIFEKEQPISRTSADNEAGKRKKADMVLDSILELERRRMERAIRKNKKVLYMPPCRPEDKKEKIQRDIKHDAQKNEDLKSRTSVSKKEKLIKEHKQHDRAEELKKDLSRTVFKETPYKSEKEENNSDTKNRKPAYATYEDYVLWKKQQKKKQKEQSGQQDSKAYSVDGNDISKFEAGTKKDRAEKQDKKNPPNDERKDSGRKDKKSTKRTKRKSRAVDPIVMNAKRNLSLAKNKVKNMPIKTMRMVAEDVSADEAAMRAGKGITRYMSGIYANIMKSVAAVWKSIGLLVADAMKNILIALAPALLAGLVIIFLIFVIFLSPLKIFLGIGGEGEEPDAILMLECSEELKNAAARLEKDILSHNPDADIKILPVSKENSGDLYRIISYKMALSFECTADEWIVSPEGRAELVKYADIMCHQLSKEEIEKHKENETEETTEEETTSSEEETQTGGQNEPESEQQTPPEPKKDEIWIGYYGYDYLMENGYLEDMDEIMGEYEKEWQYE